MLTSVQNKHRRHMPLPASLATDGSDTHLKLSPLHPTPSPHASPSPRPVQEGRPYAGRHPVLQRLELLRSRRDRLPPTRRKPSSRRGLFIPRSTVFDPPPAPSLVTMDLSAANINKLDSDHWLSDARNVKVLRLNEQAWVSSSSTLPRTVTQDPRDVMRRWRAADVTAFLTANDLEGPADVLFKNGVGGEDLATLTMAVMTRDLRLSAFAAGKILTARSAFLG